MEMGCNYLFVCLYSPLQCGSHCLCRFSPCSEELPISDDETRAGLGRGVKYTICPIAISCAHLGWWLAGIIAEIRGEVM